MPHMNPVCCHHYHHGTVEVVGDLMEAVDIYSLRWRVFEFPSDEQLAAMGDAS